MTDTSEAAVKRIEGAVKEAARDLINREYAFDWPQALANAAEAVVPPGWEWSINKFVGASSENASFNLTAFVG